MKNILKIIMGLILAVSSLKVTAQTGKGVETFYKHLGNHIKYPVEARNNGTQGYTMVTFNVSKNSVGDVAVKTILGDNCDAEAVKQILNYKGFGDFKDGNYALKVKFLLQGTLTEGTIKNASVETPKGYKALDEIVIVGYMAQQKTGALTDKLKGKVSGINISTTDPKLQPLVILDSNEISYRDMQNIDQNNIASVEVLKDVNATNLYGSKGKNGVIIISSKNPISGIKIVGYGSKNLTDQLEGKIVGIDIKGKDLKEPLYILDGEEITKQELSALNPNTISSVEVLKDASSTALYGLAGTNGVIKIITKEAKEKSKN